jgi:recombination protein RecA
LVQLAGRYDAALICLTQKTAAQPSLGSLVSLRADLVRRPIGSGRFICRMQILKDKRKGPGRCFSEEYRGPDGLC